MRSHLYYEQRGVMERTEWRACGYKWKVLNLKKWRGQKMFKLWLAFKPFQIQTSWWIVGKTRKNIAEIYMLGK